MYVHRGRKGVERSLLDLYAWDPGRADAIVFGRRGGLRGAALAAMGAAVGGAIPFANHLPAGLLPAALAQPTAPVGAPRTLDLPGKAALTLLGERLLVAEAPEHMLDDDITPTDKFFIRNNDGIPDPFTGDPRAWRMRVGGEVERPLDIPLGELEARFPLVTLRLQMECGGNGRASFSTETRGNQWGNGAIACAEWTGVRLRDLPRPPDSGPRPCTPATTAPTRTSRATRTDPRSAAARPSPKRWRSTRWSRFA